MTAPHDEPPEPRDSAHPRTDLERAAWPEPSGAAAEALRAAGEEDTAPEGHVFFDVGDEGYDLVWLLDGAVDLVDRQDDQVVTRVSAPHFVGELGMLLGQKTFLAAVASEPCRYVRVTRRELRRLVAHVPEVADLVVTAFAARRRLLVEWGEGGMVVVGRRDEAETSELLEFATRNRIPFEFLDRGEDAEAVAELAAARSLPADGAAVVLGESTILDRPTRDELARATGLRLSVDDSETFDLAVVGAGPAGLAAAVLAASEGLATVVVEDTAVGGQAGSSSRIENYLGFATGVSGIELAYQATIQAVKFGARIAVPCRAVSLEEGRDDDGEGACYRLGLDDGQCVRARTVILANGVQYRRLPVPGIRRLEGAGVYYAATELEARHCAESAVVVVGGGNSAGQAAIFLSRHARRVHVAVREEGVVDTMSSYLCERIDTTEGVELVTCCDVVAVHGRDHLEAVTLRHAHTGEERRIDTAALFVMIGAVPHTRWLADRVDLDDGGYVITGRGGEGRSPFETCLPGVFAVGDIRSGSVKRVASAVGEGSVVVADVHEALARAAVEDAQRRW